MHTDAEAILAKAARRFATKYGVAIRAVSSQKPAEALSIALLHPDRAVERRLWLRVAAYHRRRYGAHMPPTSSGKSNAAIRFLAAHQLTPGMVVAGRQAEQLVAAWDREVSRVLRSPDAPVWRYEWWVDTRRRFRVTLSFTANGSATAGFTDCDGKCVNTSPQSTTPGQTSHKSAEAAASGISTVKHEPTTRSASHTGSVAQDVPHSTTTDFRHSTSGGISEG